MDWTEERMDEIATRWVPEASHYVSDADGDFIGIVSHFTHMKLVASFDVDGQLCAVGVILIGRLFEDAEDLRRMHREAKICAEKIDLLRRVYGCA